MVPPYNRMHLEHTRGDFPTGVATRSAGKCTTVTPLVPASSGHRIRTPLTGAFR